MEHFTSGILLGLWLFVFNLPAMVQETIYHDMVVTSSTANSEGEVRLGTAFNMTCRYRELTSNYGKPSITWSKKNNCIGRSGTDTIFTSSGQGSDLLDGFSIQPESLEPELALSSGSIHMSEAEVFDSSCYSFTYACQVQSFDGIKIAYTKHVYNGSMNITLTDPAKIVNITEDVVVTKNQDVTLFCHTTGIPKPSVTWSRLDGTPLPASIGGGYTYKAEGKDGILKLPAVTKYASGTYRCSAINRIISEPIRRSVTVHVKYAPNIMVDALRISQKLGYHTELKCQVEANPNDITASWYYLSEDNSTSVSRAGSSAQYRISINQSDERRKMIQHFDKYNITTGSTLIIGTVTKSDYNTQYCCRFANSLGSTSRCIDVIESDSPVLVNGRKPRRGQSSNHSISTVTISHTLILISIVFSLLFM